MAKKKITPSELMVEEKLKLLYQLQTTLSEIDRLRLLRGELPIEVEDLEDEVEGLRTRIENTERDIHNIHENVNELKAKMAKSNSLIETYKEQLNNVRNSREFDTLNKEVEFQNLEVELCEKRIEEAGRLEQAKRELVEQTHIILDERMQDLEIKFNEPLAVST